MNRSLVSFICILLLGVFIYFCGNDVCDIVTKNIYLIRDVVDNGLVDKKHRIEAVKNNEVIKLALFGDLSKFKNYGIDIKKAYEFVAEEINASRILNKKLQIVSFDKEGDVYRYQEVAKLIAEDPTVFGVIGPFETKYLIGFSEIFASAGLFEIIPISIRDRFFENKPKSLFITSSSCDSVADAWIEFFSKNGFNNAFLLDLFEHHNGRCGVSKKILEKMFKSNLNFAYRYEIDKIDVEWLREDLKESKSYFESNNIFIVSNKHFDQTYSFELLDMVLDVFNDGNVFYDDLISLDEIKDIKFNHDRFFASCFYEDTEVFRVLINKLSKQPWYKNDFITLRIYEDLWLLADAIQKSGSYECDKISEYMLNNTLNTPLGNFSFSKDGYVDKYPACIMSISDVEKIWSNK